LQICFISIASALANVKPLNDIGSTRKFDEFPADSRITLKHSASSPFKNKLQDICKILAGGIKIQIRHGA
jgi:hypothetical protein